MYYTESLNTQVHRVIGKECYKIIVELDGQQIRTFYTQSEQYVKSYKSKTLIEYPKATFAVSKGTIKYE